MTVMNIQFYSNRQSSLLMKNGNTASLKKPNNEIIAKNTPPPINFTVSSTYNPKQINPLRQYRKQLTSINSSIPSRQILTEINKPGGTSITNTEDCYTCDNDNNTLFLKKEIYPNNEPTKCIDNCIGYQSDDPKLWKYNCCSKESNITKTASTNLSKKYCTSNRELLKRRCKTYTQNIYSNTNNQCSTDCDNNYYCNNNNIKSNGNINNEIGGDYVSAYIYKNGFRNISNGLINKDNTHLCCDDSNVLYKKNNDICKFKQFNNMHSLKLVKLC